MNKKYIVRLDDASPTMVEDKWVKVYEILKKYEVFPLVGVIPHNEDPTQQFPEIKNFWEMMQQWQADGTTIAMHGYNHCYISDKGLEGLNPIWSRSEFAGVAGYVQKKKIEEGYKILKSHGLNPTVFFAPSHTYDQTTLDCLRDFTPIRIISDTMAFNPYKDGDFIVVPQQSGHFTDMKLPGTWTFCFHPNTMTDEAIEDFECFIALNRSKFISFKDLELSRVGRKSLWDKMLSWLYFYKRNRKR